MTDSNKNYDTTAKQRMERRRKRIKDLGLKEARLLCHEDDKPKLQKLADELLKKRKIDLTP